MLPAPVQSHTFRPEGQIAGCLRKIVVAVPEQNLNATPGRAEVAAGIVFDEIGHGQVELATAIEVPPR